MTRPRRKNPRPKPLEVQFAEAYDADDKLRARDLLDEMIRAERGASAAITLDTVLKQWSEDGPLVHEPTGIKTLDELTDGGPVYGSRWYLLGAPDAGKTALLVQIADVYLARGIAVGLLAVDEEPGDLLMRFAQRCGHSRRECERRTQATLIGIHDALAGSHLRFYDASWTIERAAADLAGYAAELGVRAMLGIDSIQTVSCETEDPSRSVREAVTARAWAIRAAAQTHRMIVLSTSEMNRAAYRSVEAGESSEDLAAAKESGAIEFSARVMLSLRSVKDQPDLVELRLAKNKHGPRGERIYLELERSKQTLTETEAPAEVDKDDEREEKRAARGRKKNLTAAAAVIRCLLDEPGLTITDLRGAVRARLGTASNACVAAAVRLLGPGINKRPGKQTAVHHFVVGDRVPGDVMAELEVTERARVLAVSATLSTGVAA